MPKFRTGESRLIHDCKEYEPDSVVDLPQEVGERLGLKPASAESQEDQTLAPEDPGERLAAIKEAIGILDKGNENHFTKDGSPRVDAIEAILGYDIKAEERNQAWMDLNPVGDEG